MFGYKCYILKESRNGKFDAKSDEGIFLGYSTRSKDYKCLNTNTNKIVESANVNFDECIEVHDDESIKRLEEYKSCVYLYEGMTDEGDVANQIGNQQQTSISAESQLVNVELHSDAELQNVGNTHSNSKINTHERDEELPDRDVHSDFDVERPNIETRSEPRLSKYVRRHHPAQ